ncbi:hypothetical protein PVAND_008258 [Polypedilum vanderplanki]|uniref:Post-GPI attachment to proteins factor 3 n=1 Tax=Polypedilum vanderplanki TaxID=319348 RepID=A0A9J6C9K2_POLVA|nr:hypothetical protein PVAND_008258 [Polypedilum vanderplanki]
MFFIQKCLFILLLVSLINLASSSTGDRSPYYQNCVSTCLKQNCQNNVQLYRKGMEEKFTDHFIDLLRLRKFDVETFENMISWNCKDECKYKCMHRTCEAFIARKWNLPQFHGKWPFVRFLGVQEPASVAFSLLNLFVHYKGLMQFRASVRHDSPFFILWHVFSIICMNAWVWSTIFHTRDFPTTELFDYVFAYSMVLASFWAMVIRIIYEKSRGMSIIVTLLCVLFFLNHFAYLSYNTNFDYSYNMKVNIITGAIGGIGWIIWCLSQIRKRTYVWKMLLFVILALASIVLEVYDFPPILWTFDSHSLWHLSSAPITILFYKFITDDCIELRREAISEEKMKLL